MIVAKGVSKKKCDLAQKICVVKNNLIRLLRAIIERKLDKEPGRSGLQIFYIFNFIGRGVRIFFFRKISDQSGALILLKP